MIHFFVRKLMIIVNMQRERERERERERANVNLFSNLGFKIQQEKSRFFLSKEIEYLEIVINSENITVSLLPKN